RFLHQPNTDFRSSVVAAYVVDNSNARVTEQQLAALHHELWLHGGAPLVYVAWPTRVDILSCARSPDFWRPEDVDGEVQTAYKPAVNVPVRDEGMTSSGQAALDVAVEVSASLRARYSARRLADGTFWDDPESQVLADEDAAAHRRLIQA